MNKPIDPTPLVDQCFDDIVWSADLSFFDELTAHVVYLLVPPEPRLIAQARSRISRRLNAVYVECARRRWTRSRFVEAIAELVRDYYATHGAYDPSVPYDPKAAADLDAVASRLRQRPTLRLIPRGLGA